MMHNSRMCQNAKSNVNSSSKIEEVPAGRRSMIAQNRLIINIVNRRYGFHTPPCPPSIFEVTPKSWTG